MLIIENREYKLTRMLCNVQVMYMYYLLGYRLFGEGAEFVKEYLQREADGEEPTEEDEAKKRKLPNWLERAKLKQTKREYFGKSSIFDTMEESLVETVRDCNLLTRCIFMSS